MKKNLPKIFSYLMKKLSSDRLTQEIVNSIIERLIRGDVEKRAEFGFSLKLKRGKGIERALRFVNYDTYSPKFENLYTERIKLIENIVGSYTKSNISRLLFLKLRKLDKTKPPLYFGLEVKEKLRFKAYLHFCEISDFKEARTLAEGILKEFKLTVPPGEKRIAAIGLDLDQSLEPNYKLYYLNDSSGGEYLTREGLSVFEQKILSLLKPFIVHSHFGWRYQGNKLLSKKFGVQLKNGLKKEMIKKTLVLNENSNSLGKILDIIKESEGKIHVIDIEKDNLIFYIRF